MSNIVLCAIDLLHEDEAREVIRQADQMAALRNADLAVMTVLPDYGTSFVGSFFKSGTLKEAADAANKALHALVSATLPDRAEVQHIVEIGGVYEKVLSQIESCGAELVVIGAHKPEMSDGLLGPNAARIARRSPVSTYVVRM